MRVTAGLHRNESFVVLFGELQEYRTVYRGTGCRPREARNTCSQHFGFLTQNSGSSILKSLSVKIRDSQ